MVSVISIFSRLRYSCISTTRRCTCTFSDDATHLWALYKAYNEIKMQYEKSRKEFVIQFAICHVYTLHIQLDIRIYTFGYPYFVHQLLLPLLLLSHVKRELRGSFFSSSATPCYLFAFKWDDEMPWQGFCFTSIKHRCIGDRIAVMHFVHLLAFARPQNAKRRLR